MLEISCFLQKVHNFLFIHSTIRKMSVKRLFIRLVNIQMVSAIPAISQKQSPTFSLNVLTIEHPLLFLQTVID